MAYPRPDEVSSSYLSILFWNGISSFGYQGMFTAGSLVACSNLEWRRNTSWSSVPVAYCSEKSIFTCNPRHMYLTKELRDLKTLVKVNFQSYCFEIFKSLKNLQLELILTFRIRFLMLNHAARRYLHCQKGLSRGRIRALRQFQHLFFSAVLIPRVLPSFTVLVTKMYSTDWKSYRGMVPQSICRQSSFKIVPRGLRRILLQ